MAVYKTITRKAKNSVDSFRLSDLNRKLTGWIGFIIRLSILMMLILLVLMIYSEVKNERYVLERFELTESLANEAFTGRMVGLKIQDELNNIENQAIIRKKVVGLDWDEHKHKVEMQLPAIGITVQPIINYLKSALGYRNNKITGEVYQDADTLFLSVRITGYPVEKFFAPVSASRNEALNSLVKQAGFYITEKIDPALLIGYYTNFKDYNRVRELVDKTLEDPNHPDKAFFYSLKGYNLGFSKNYKEAESYFQKAIEEDEELPIVYSNWGSMLIRKGELTAGFQKIMKAKDLDPEMDAVYSNLGLYYLLKGDYEKASANYLIADSLAPGHSFYSNATYAYLYNGQPEKAIQLIESKKKQDQLSNYLLYKINYYNYTGQFDSALVTLQSINATNWPNKNVPHSYLTLLAHASKGDSIAEKYLHLLPPGGNKDMVSAVFSLKTENKEECYKYLEKVFEKTTATDRLAKINNPVFKELWNEERFNQMKKKYLNYN